jgi:hypothetical protein
MVDSSSDRADTLPTAGTSPTREDNRQNLVLRELVDEMMASIRAAARRDLWTPDERAQYEDELAMIMMRVRKEAVHTPEKHQA